MAEEAAQQAAAGASSAQSSSQSGSQQQSGQQAAAQDGASQSTSQAAAASKPERPAYIPENLYDPADPKQSKFTEHYNKLASAEASERSRKLALPQTPEEIQFALPKDFKAPEGFKAEEFKFDEKNPALVEARKVAHELGIGQEGFSKFLALYAGSQFQSMQEMKAAHEGEIAKLGAAGPARVDAVNDWLKASLGDDGFKALSPMMVTAGIVQQFERLMQKVVSQGGASFSQAHREHGNENGKIPGYDKMSFEQKREAQDNLRAAQRRA